MSLTKEIISKALHLKPAEKSIVIEALMKSLDVPDPEIEKIKRLFGADSVEIVKE